jgi:hypothetical protein
MKAGRGQNGEPMNDKLNSLLKMACDAGSKYAKNLKDVDPQAVHDKAAKFIKTASDVSNKYARTFTGMDAPTLLNKYGKQVGGGLVGLAAVSLLAYALRPQGEAQNNAAAEPEPASPPDAPAGGPIDPRIVGSWRHTWAKGDPISGLSLAVDDWLILNADGTCQVGSTRAAGGNSFIGMDTGRSELHRGFWRAQNKDLFVSDDGQQWARVGSYICDGSNLLVKSGENKVYTRQ